jgi:uncharacterized protein
MVVITSTTPKLTVLALGQGSNFIPVTISAIVQETNPALTRVGATLDWNDGTQPVIFSPSNPLSINVTRNLGIGTYYVEITGFNYIQPAPQVVNAFLTVEIQPNQMAPVVQPFVFGPILPLDDQSPNVLNWNFNLGSNLEILKSSIKMLLITTKGERIMQPTYGTFLRRIIFSPNTDSVYANIQQEITDALTQFEPRASLQDFTVQSSNRSVTVNANFLSKINQNTFVLTLPFTQ